MFALSMELRQVTTRAVMTVGTLALLKVSKAEPNQRAVRGLLNITFDATRETIIELLGLAESVDSSVVEHFYTAEEEDVQSSTTSIVGEGNLPSSSEYVFKGLFRLRFSSTHLAER